MISSCTTPPLWLNGWKHHRGFICQQMADVNLESEKGFADFCLELKTMGSSVSDFYTGTLDEANIREQILTFLDSKGIASPASYLKWVEASKGKFRETELSDGSRWTLLEGKDPLYYIHIHPSRYSPNSIRVKTNLLRTAVALIVWQEQLADNDLLPETINSIRQNYLNLSPVDQMQMEGIEQTVKMIRQGCPQK